MNAAQFAAKHPWCCFCGGTEPTRTIDHQPPRILFVNKARPKGLEFPACKVCNEQTRGDEALAALIARFTGGHRFKTLRADSGIVRAGKAVLKKYPLIFNRIVKSQWATVNGVHQRVMTLNAGDPQVERSMCLMSAKLALAAYYEHHHAICPASVKINTLWMHNQRADMRDVLPDVLRKCPTPILLKQGTWNTEDTFFLRYFHEGDIFVSAAVLHESGGLLALIAREETTENWVDWSYVWQPSPGKRIVRHRGR